MRASMTLFLVFALASATVANASSALMRITGIKSTESVNLRERPSKSSSVLARLPHDARGLKSLGVTADDTGKPIAKANAQAWCGVEFEDLSGWVACRYLTTEQ